MSERYTRYLILKRMKGGYKGMFSELDTINEYSHEFGEILGKHGDDEKGVKAAIIEFTKMFLPCIWSDQEGRYVSVFDEWVTGEVNLVNRMPDYCEWDIKTKAEVRHRMKLWNRYLTWISNHESYRLKPKLSVTKGTNLLLPD